MRVGIVDAAATRALRRAVLRPNLAPGDPLPGDAIADGVHLGAVDGADVIGACFVYRDECPWRPDVSASWHLRQMATAEGRRGQGVGGRVLGAAIELSRVRGADLLWCHAREGAIDFYRRHGFLAHGEVFTDAAHSIPHLCMALDLGEPEHAPASSQ